MDCSEIGSIIYRLRKEKQLTQLQLAEMLSVSDKTISKWERGLGCPDVSLLCELSKVLAVDIKSLLSGELYKNVIKGGNMKNIKFYCCPECGNIITTFGEADISCCGRKLEALVPQTPNEKHSLVIEELADETHVHLNHGMSKEHYISFIASVNYDKVLITKLYPEQDCEIYLPKLFGCQYYLYCNIHGLFKM